jgi:hypothetical protein
MDVDSEFAEVNTVHIQGDLGSMVLDGSMVLQDLNLSEVRSHSLGKEKGYGALCP